MDTEKLKALVVLAELLNFSRAADQLHMSASTLSRLVSQMEQEFKVALFVRNNRSVQLTEAGRRCYEYAKSSLAELSTLQQELIQASGVLKGDISIYCSVTASYSFLHEILAAFRQDYPQIRFILHTGDHAQALERITQGAEDVAIAARPDVLRQGIVFKPITQSPLVFIESVAAPATHGQIAWQELPLILPEQGVGRVRIERWFAQQGIQPWVQAQVGGHEAIVSMVSLGFGVGLVPKVVVDNSPLAEQVRLFRVQPEVKPYEVGVCVLEKRLKSPLVQAFWDML
ncbi:MAG: HTH-type transcriptional activator IlvY [Pseudomonadota bacterium]|jgi:LysR family positive regulator for ilvC